MLEIHNKKIHVKKNKKRKQHYRRLTFLVIEGESGGSGLKTSEMRVEAVILVGAMS